MTLAGNSLFAARPTVHASNLTVSLITCNSLQLNWTYGDGTARLIVAREGAATSWVPSDNVAYSPNSNFGKGADQNGAGNYIVYNAGGTNFVKIDSLKTGKVYYFTIFEHDNAGSSTLYYTSGAPQINATMQFINLKFGIDFLDSCEDHNSFRLMNTSKSSISALTYTFFFGDATSKTSIPSDTVYHSYKNKSGQINIRLNASPNLGCVSDISSVVRIYPKKNAYIDYSTFEDTQCLDGNYFVVDPKPIISPLPKYFTYNWSFGDKTFSTFKKMKKVYGDSGLYHVEAEIVTNVGTSATGCKDTLRFAVYVLPSPIGSASVNDTFQCLTYNNFVFTNKDNSLTYYKWYYGNNDSTSQRTFSYSYSKVGKDTIIHVAYSSTGCKGRDTVIIDVLDDLVSDFSISPQYCSSNTPVTIVPVVAGGVFEDFPLDANNSFIPLQIGKHQLSYIVASPFCRDTTTKKFEILQTPVPSLGNDFAVCKEDPQILNANYSSGSYLWNTGETSQSISINASGRYWVDVTENNCKGTDSINVVYSTTPIIELGKDTSVCKGNKLVLNVANQQSTYLWQDGTTDSVYFVFNSGKYAVTVNNPCGMVQDSIFVFFQTDYCDLFMANAFSPDNDLINNVFIPVGKNISVDLFQIYNKWGQLIFQTDKNDVGWNGTFQGEQCSQDLYVWRLFYSTPSGYHVKKNNASGTVLLLR